MKKIIIPIVIIILLILVFSIYYTYEGFQADNTPKVENSRIRIDNTCSDPNQTNIFDRFKFVLPLDKDDSCASYTNYVIYSNYPFNQYKVCVPICDGAKGWSIHPFDKTYCTRSDCVNTLDLSGEIKKSWSYVCTPLARQNYTLTSTLNSISSVTNAFNRQFNMAESNYFNLRSRRVDFVTANCPGTSPTNPFPVTLSGQPPPSPYCSILNLGATPLANSYTTLRTLRDSINTNANQLSNKMGPFKNVYRSFGCDLV
jgi:hypothetical protein